MVGAAAAAVEAGAAAVVVAAGLTPKEKPPLGGAVPKIGYGLKFVQKLRTLR